MHIVELEKGVWLAPWEGDPGRTLKIENALKFITEYQAKVGLRFAQQHRPFENGRVINLEESTKKTTNLNER